MENILATMTALEKLSLGGSTLLIGLVMVFIVLGLLIGIVTLVHVILDKNAKRKSKKASAPVAVAAKPVASIATNNNEEIVAAISAAISMYYETQSMTTGKSVKFRVRSIKEIR